MQLFSQRKTSQSTTGHDTQPVPLPPDRLTVPEEGPSPPEAPKPSPVSDGTEGAEESTPEHDYEVDFF